jgi:hypothetical protein
MQTNVHSHILPLPDPKTFRVPLHMVASGISIPDEYLFLVFGFFVMLFSPGIPIYWIVGML